MSDFKTVQTEDERPILKYKGRTIEIESEGTGPTTKIKIDGKEMQTVTWANIYIRAGEMVRVKMQFIDIEGLTTSEKKSTA